MKKIILMMMCLFSGLVQAASRVAPFPHEQPSQEREATQQATPRYSSFTAWMGKVTTDPHAVVGMLAGLPACKPANYHLIDEEVMHLQEAVVERLLPVGILVITSYNYGSALMAAQNNPALLKIVHERASAAIAHMMALKLADLLDGGTPIKHRKIDDVTMPELGTLITQLAAKLGRWFVTGFTDEVKKVDADTRKDLVARLYKYIKWWNAVVTTHIPKELDRYLVRLLPKALAVLPQAEPLVGRDFRQNYNYQMFMIAARLALISRDAIPMVSAALRSPVSATDEREVYDISALYTALRDGNDRAVSITLAKMIRDLLMYNNIESTGYAVLLGAEDLQANIQRALTSFNEGDLPGLMVSLSTLPKNLPDRVQAHIPAVPAGADEFASDVGMRAMQVAALPREEQPAAALRSGREVLAAARTQLPGMTRHVRERLPALPGRMPTTQLPSLPKLPGLPSMAAVKDSQYMQSILRVAHDPEALAPILRYLAQKQGGVAQALIVDGYKKVTKNEVVLHLIKKINAELPPVNPAYSVMPKLKTMGKFNWRRLFLPAGSRAMYDDIMLPLYEQIVLLLDKLMQRLPSATASGGSRDLVKRAAAIKLLVLQCLPQILQAALDSSTTLSTERRSLLETTKAAAQLTIALQKAEQGRRVFSGVRAAVGR